jgi:hypothetical protein
MPSMLDPLTRTTHIALRLLGNTDLFAQKGLVKASSVPQNSPYGAELLGIHSR